MVERSSILDPPREIVRLPFEISPLVLLRHGRDKETLTNALDQPLDRNHIGDTYRFAHSLVDYYKEKSSLKKLTGVTIVSSDRQRSRQTAEICAEALNSSNISYNTQKEPLIRGLDQGNFLINPKLVDLNGEYTPLVIAWKAFTRAWKSGLIDYRYGEPTYPATDDQKHILSENFVEPGESQRAFSLRVYKFLKDLDQADSSKLHLIVTHYIVVSKIQRLISSLASFIDEFPKDNLLPGEFIKKYEQLGNRTLTIPAKGISLDLGTVRWASQILESEYTYLIKNG